MNRFLALIVLIFMGTNFAFSQIEGEDLVRLKNGTTVRGIIIEQHPGEFIRVLQIPSNDTIKIMLVDIETLLKLVPKTEEKEVINTPTVENNLDSISTIDSTKINPFNQHLFQVRFNISKIFKDYAGEGYGLTLARKIGSETYAGLGFNYFKGRINLPYQARNSVAIFGDINQDIRLTSKGRLGFRAGLGFGYNIDFSDTYFDIDAGKQVSISNGIYLHPNVGLRLNLSKNTGLLFDIGYQYIHANILNPATNLKIEGRNWSSVVFRVSVFF